MSSDPKFTMSSIARFKDIERVIVVGAGLAGLGVARALVDRKYKVTVLEARDRMGGRCWTKDGFDYGAHWIHGTEGNPITNLARQLQVSTLFVGGDSTYTGGWTQLALHASENHVFTGEEKLSSILLADEVWDDLDALRREQPGIADVSLRQAVEQVLANRSVTDAERQAIDWHLALLARDDCAAGDDALSFRSWDDGYEVYGYGDSILVGGYSALIDKLAAGLDVRLNHAVHDILHYEAIGVSVKTSQGDFEGDAVVVTVPLGVLKSGAIRFMPSLPERKQTAIDRLGMGSLAKVLVRFEQVFWPAEQYVFGYRCKPVSGQPSIVVNLWKHLRQPALVLLIGGESGRQVETCSEADLREWALTALRDLFGEDVPTPVEISRSNWSDDPYSRGAYAYIAVGSSPEDIEALAEPVGKRLLFAGEATYRSHWATTHGAYASALREAARITGDPGLLPVRHTTENRRWRDMTMRLTRFINVMSRTLDEGDLKARVAVLNDSQIFSAIPPEDRRMLATMFESVTFADGEVICRAGDPATKVYVIAEGEIEVSLSAGQVVNMLERGDVVGDYGMFGERVRTATLTSRGRSAALTLDYQRFQRFLLAFPEAAVALLGMAISRMMGVIQKLAANGDEKP